MKNVYDVAIIGGGLAGTALAHELGKRSLSCVIIERGNTLAFGASGNDQGLIVPYLTAAETLTRSLYEQAFDSVTADLADLENDDLLPSLRQCGAIQFASSLRPQKVIDALKTGALHSPRAHRISAQEISELLQTPVSHDALFYPEALVLSPPELCNTWVKKISCDILKESSALTLSQSNDLWETYTRHGVCIAKSQSVIIANAFDCVQFSQTSWLQVEKIRGQILTLPSTRELNKISSAVCFDGYLLPSYNGSILIGASYDHTFLDPNISEERTLDMVRRLQKQLPSLQLPPHHSGSSRVSFRTSTHDRLPYVGQVPNYEWVRKELPEWSRLRENEVPMISNLYVSVGHGSRGLLSAPLSAKLLTNIITGTSCHEHINQFSNSLSPMRLINRIIKREELRG